MVSVRIPGTRFPCPSEVDVNNQINRAWIKQTTTVNLCCTMSRAPLTPAQTMICACKMANNVTAIALLLLLRCRVCFPSISLVSMRQPRWSEYRSKIKTNYLHLQTLCTRTWRGSSSCTRGARVLQRAANVSKSQKFLQRDSSQEKLLFVSKKRFCVLLPSLFCLSFRFVSVSIMRKVPIP